MLVKYFIAYIFRLRDGSASRVLLAGLWPAFPLVPPGGLHNLNKLI